jgi:two-component system phosphate regulon sensor histidine kinase PhoR
MINRLEAGEINLTVSKFDVNLLIKEIFDLLDLEAEKIPPYRSRPFTHRFL